MALVWNFRQRMSRNAPQGMNGGVLTEEHIQAFCMNRGLRIPVVILDAIVDADITYRAGVTAKDEGDDV